MALTALKLLVRLRGIVENAASAFPMRNTGNAMDLPTKPKRRSPNAPPNRSDGASSIALIDKRPLMRHCFGRWLEESARDAHITVASPAEILDNTQLGREAHLIVYSIGAARVADPEVIDSIHGLARSFAEVPIVLLSDRDDVEEVAKAIRHGVRGYVSTKLELSELAAAIHCVEAGGFRSRRYPHQVRVAPAPDSELGPGGREEAVGGPDAARDGGRRTAAAGEAEQGDRLRARDQREYREGLRPADPDQTERAQSDRGRSPHRGTIRQHASRLG
jgi:CheY-like chemotaxis protein